MVSGEHLEFDVIVIGLGSMGISTCYYTAVKGMRVLGIEQFSILHNRGSHSGASRIVRKAYFEDARYVPMLKRAYNLWDELEQKSSRNLFNKCGLLYFGDQENEIISGVEHSSRLHDIDIDHIDSEKLSSRFPQFNIPDSFSTVFEQDAGYVSTNQVIPTLKDLAISSGAKLLENTPVLDWYERNDEVIVVTKEATFKARKLVLCLGAWHSGVPNSNDSKIEVTQQDLYWVRPNKSDIFDDKRFPVWTIDDPEYPGIFYGFPLSEDSDFPGLLKIAHHTKGKPCRPDATKREADLNEGKWLLKHLSQYIPKIGNSIEYATTCLYANSPDQNFIIDKNKDSKHIYMALGFSGHGFKFVPVIGEILSELLSKGESDLDISFLSTQRFS